MVQARRFKVSYWYSKPRPDQLVIIDGDMGMTLDCPDPKGMLPVGFFHPELEPDLFFIVGSKYFHEVQLLDAWVADDAIFDDG